MSRTAKAYHAYKLWRVAVAQRAPSANHYWGLYLSYMEPRW